MKTANMKMARMKMVNENAIWSLLDADARRNACLVQS